MLRGGAQAIGASKTLLVSHSPAIVSLCDVAIRVTDGRLEVPRSVLDRDFDDPFYGMEVK